MGSGADGPSGRSPSRCDTTRLPNNCDQREPIRSHVQPNSALKRSSGSPAVVARSRHRQPEGGITMKTGALRNRLSLVPLFVIGTLIVLAPLALRAGPFVTGALVQVSGPSPFPTGTADDGAGKTARDPSGQRTVFLNSEVEPWVDVNPTNPNNIVAFWQQDRWSDGGSRGLVAGVSFDGGTTWQSVVVPGITLCSGGTLQRATDPWLSFAPNGIVHQISLALDIDPPANRPGGNGRNALLVRRSTDGGLTWTAPITIIADDNPRFLNDKQSITADPTDANFVYAVWDRLKSSSGHSINP